MGTWIVSPGWPKSKRHLYSTIKSQIIKLMFYSSHRHPGN
jgi:hypothetical protein